MSLIFEWDSNKAKANLKKHGISFEEACTVFGDFLSVTIPDPVHSSHQEERLITMGQSLKGQTIIIAHTEKGDKIRIISARKARAHERKIYEEG